MNRQFSYTRLLKVGYCLLLIFTFSSCNRYAQKATYSNYENAQNLTRESRTNIVELEWPWQELGPTKTPFEKNAGGKAIPSYAANRGNGTGRVNFIYVNPVNPQNVFACSPTGGLFVTYNGGDTWRNAGTDQLDISGVAAVSVNPSDQDQWIMATGDSDDQFKFSDGIWMTYNAGENWVNINGLGNHAFPVKESLGSRTYVSDVVGHPCDFNRVIVASNKGLFTTDNAMDEPKKVKWKRVDDSFYFDIEILPWDQSKIFAGGNRFIGSDDFGKTWKTLDLPEYNNKEKFSFLRISLVCTLDDTEHIYAAVTNSESVTQSDSGEALFQKFHIENKSWEFIRSLRKQNGNMITTRARAIDISPKNSNIVLVGNVQPIYRSEDGGLNFKAIEKRQMHDDIHCIAFAPNGNDVYASHDGGISKSTDGGLTWTIKDLGIGVANVFGCAVAQEENDLIAYGGYDTGANVLLGSNWYHVLWGDGFQTIINPNNSNEIYVSRQGGYLRRSDDGGYTWENDIRNKQSWMAWHSWLRMNPITEDIFIAGDLLSRSKDKGETWETLLNIPEVDGSWTFTYKLFVSETDPNLLFAFVLTKKDPFEPVLLKTADLHLENPNEMEWEEIPLPLNDWISAVVVDPEDSNKFWISYKRIPQGKLFYFDGNDFTSIGENLGLAEIQSLAIDKYNKQLYVGTSYGVFTKKNNDKEWIRLKGLPGVQVNSMDINYVTQELIVGTFGRGIWKCPLIKD